MEFWTATYWLPMLIVHQMFVFREPSFPIDFFVRPCQTEGPRGSLRAFLCANVFYNLLFLKINLCENIDIPLFCTTNLISFIHPSNYSLLPIWSRRICWSAFAEKVLSVIIRMERQKKYQCSEKRQALGKRALVESDEYMLIVKC